LSSADLAVYESRWRARLGSYLKTSSRIRRRLFTKLADPEIDKLLGALMFDDVQRAIRQTIRFNWHGELIRAILHQPGVKSVLFHNPPARHSPRSSRRTLAVGTSISLLAYPSNPITPDNIFSAFTQRLRLHAVGISDDDTVALPLRVQVWPPSVERLSI